jgi:NAD(P)-dependent dehydrogenase (short-subunit alcohol dehydrogenase family)
MTIEKFSIKDKIIVLTGGAGHVVGGLVENFVKQGARCISVDLRPEKLSNQAEELQKEGFYLDTYCLNVTEESSWSDLLIYVINKYGSVDALINGAGINAPSTFLDIDNDKFQEIFQVNTFGTMLGCKVFGKEMVNKASGSIVNISSTSSDPPLSKAFAYSASKAAVTNLTKNIAREFGKTGVRVNALRPGFFPTEWNKKNFLTKERTESILNHTPMGRFGEPHELCGAVQWLISEASEFVTGTEIIVDGGFSCQSV